MSRPTCSLRPLSAVLLALLLTSPLLAQARGDAESSSEAPATLTAAQLQQILAPIPNPVLDDLEPAVREIIELREQHLRAAVAGRQVAAVAAAYGELGYLYHAHGMWQQALTCYRNAELLQPGEPRWPYAAALAFRETGALEPAAESYERSLGILPRNPAALIGLAEIRLEQNQPVWARDLLRHALELNPEGPAILATLGQVALSQQRYGEAASVLERALTQQPEANRLHYPLGLAYRGLGDLEKAREHLARRGEVGVRPADPVRDAIEARKTGERVMLLEGRRAFAAERFAEAVELFEKALESAPESIPARVNLASARAMVGDQAGAIELYREVLEKNPENEASLFNLGLLLSQQGQDDEAVDLLEKAAEASPEDAEVRMQLARILAREGQLEEAAKWAEESTSKAPADQSTWLLAAQLEQALGRWSKARDVLLEAHRLMPDQGLVAHDLARLLAASPDASLRDGERALRLATQVANAAATLTHVETVALALAELGRCEEAAATQRQVVEAAGEDALRYRSDLERYEAGPPCRPPASPDGGDGG